MFQENFINRAILLIEPEGPNKPETYFFLQNWVAYETFNFGPLVENT